MMPMTPDRSRKILRVIYIVNLVLVGIILFLVLLNLINEWRNPSDSQVPYWNRVGLTASLFYVVLAWPVFVVFLFLNIWMAFLDKARRKQYLIISICLAIFLVLTLPAVYEWYSNGAPMP